MALFRTTTLLLALLALATLGMAPLARGQSDPSDSVNALSGAPGHLLGNWGGLRQQLANDGINLGVSYLGETAWNVAGGKRIGADYAGQEEVKLGLDLGKLANLPGLSVHIDFVNRNGRNASADYVGDDLLHAQEIYGGGGDVLVHLTYAYIEKKFAGGTVTAKVGRLPVMHDFGALPDGCDFMSLTMCATRPLDITVGWTSFPRATWGGNVAVKVAKPLTLAVGAYEVNPNTGGPSGFHWSLAGAEGVMLPLQLTWEPKFGPDKLPGMYRVGVFWDTARLADWDTAVDGAALPTTSLPASRSQRTGFYLLAQQMLWRTGPQPGEGLTVLAGYIHNSPDNAVFQHFALIGLLDRGLIPGRPYDRAGLAFVHLRVSNDLTDAQEQETALGEPLSYGAPGIQTTEMLVEANYNIAAWRGVGIMPDVQWVIRPSASTHYGNALVLGLQVKVTF